MEKYHPSRVIQDFVFLSRKVVVSGVFLCRYIIKFFTCIPDQDFHMRKFFLKYPIPTYGKDKN